MGQYLAYSHQQVARFLPCAQWDQLTPQQHESLAAFRVRFSELQEQLGKAMRAIAIEEEAPTEPFGAILALMERLGIIEDTPTWRITRELRNAVNHEYEDRPEILAAFFSEMQQRVGILQGWLARLIAHCQSAYGLQ